MQIKGVAFDLEGTLINIEAAHHQGHLAVAAELGVNLSIEQAINKIPAFIGGPDIEVAKSIKKLAKSDTPIEYIIERKKLHFQQFLPSIEIKLRPNAAGFIVNLIKANIKITIGTVTAKEDAINLIKKANLDHFFEIQNIVFLEDVKKSKPSPDVYIETAKRLGIKPREQLVIEDSIVGVKAAVSAGSQVIAIPTIQTKDFKTVLLNAGASKVFFNWDQLSLNEIDLPFKH